MPRHDHDLYLGEHMIDSSDALRSSRMLRTLAGFSLLAFAGALTACDSSDDIIVPNVIEGVTTFHDESFNFGALRTFAMPDTVVHLVPLAGQPIEVSRQFDQTALNQVRANLLARGFIEVDPHATTPDFVVLVGATASQNFQAFVNYSWFSVWGFYDWSWYAPGFNTSWGIVYPWQPSVALLTFDRGTMVVDLIPTVTVNPLNSTITSKWAGVASAVLDGSIVSGTIAAAVDQMFALSPYLRPAASPGHAAPEMGSRLSLQDALLGR